MMLDYLGFVEAGRAVETAVRNAIAENETSQDLGGTLSTEQVGDAIIRRLG